MSRFQGGEKNPAKMMVGVWSAPAAFGIDISQERQLVHSTKDLSVFLP
jgi:hypothetical protein